ncbi:MAG TPA: PH domain-containing protein [Mycobacteriales bacterium]|nr:PH domain-containing protein [Mycobacteriales bacterium]
MSEPAPPKPAPTTADPATPAPAPAAPAGLPPGTLLRLRPSRVGLMVVLVLAVCMTPFAGQRLYLVPLYLIPIVLLWWLLRAGTDIDDHGVTVRAMLGSRHWDWDDLRGFSTTGRGKLVAVLPDGRIVRLPSARARHLELIGKVSGGRVPQIS